MKPTTATANAYRNISHPLVVTASIGAKAVPGSGDSEGSPGTLLCGWHGISQKLMPGNIYPCHVEIDSDSIPTRARNGAEGRM